MNPSPVSQRGFAARADGRRAARPHGVLRYCAWGIPMLVIAAGLCGCSRAGALQAEHPQEAEFQVASAAFKPGEEIPKEFTCEGKDISPELRWTRPPRGTRSFVLIVEDPDAPSGTWIHWVVYDLPARVRALPGNVPKQAEVPGGGVQGRNDFGRLGYGGPCPPPGGAHRYYFKLYALDAMLRLRPGAKKEEVLRLARRHVLGEAQLMARFRR